MNLSILIKPASGMCNMRCKYCFYRDEAENREVFSFGKMSFSTAENLIKKALELADGDSIAFAFQGGEPLLAGIDYFRDFTEAVNRLNTKNSPIYYSIQTNGTLVDDEWARFFFQNRFLVGLSLDGDFAGNKFRVGDNDNNEYYKITRAAKKLAKNKVEFNILIVLTGYCAENIDRIYSYFRSNGYRYLQFIPCLRPMDDTERTPNELFMTSDQYAHFLIHAFNRYVKDFARGEYVSIRQFDNLVRMYNGENAEQCGLMGHCTHQLVIEGNGNIYPCDFYCTDEYLLGNVNDDTPLDSIVNSDKAKAFIAESLVIPERCKNCVYYKLCRGGGCKRERQSEDYCKAYKQFFSSCLPLFRVFTKIQ